MRTRSKKRKDAIVRFMQGYREAVDWMYASPDAVQMFSKKTGVAEDLVRKSMKRVPAQGDDADRRRWPISTARCATRSSSSSSMSRCTKEQLADFIQIPPRTK